VLHLPSPAGLFIYSSRGSVPSPLSSGVFLPLPLLHAFPLQGCCMGATTPAFSSYLVYLQFCEILPLLPFSAQGALPSLLCVFFVVYYSVCFLSLFSLGVGWSVQGAVLIWPRVVCGSNACCLAHLVVCISQAGRKWCLVAREPSWFLCLIWSGDAMHGLGVWSSWSFASSWWFSL
jgi:hypothetical protein